MKHEYAESVNVCLAFFWGGTGDLRVMFVQHKMSATKNVRIYGSIEPNGLGYSIAPLF